LLRPRRRGRSLRKAPHPARSYRRSDTSSTAMYAAVPRVRPLLGVLRRESRLPPLGGSALADAAGGGGLEPPEPEAGFLGPGAGAAPAGATACACLNLYLFSPQPTQGMRSRVHLEHAGLARSHWFQVSGIHHITILSRPARHYQPDEETVAAAWGLSGTFFFCLRHASQPRPVGTPAIVLPRARFYWKRPSRVSNAATPPCMHRTGKAEYSCTERAGPKYKLFLDLRVVALKNCLLQSGLRARSPFSFCERDM
jgi:hypothetical protein